MLIFVARWQHSLRWRHNTQHEGLIFEIRHNDIQHQDTQEKWQIKWQWAETTVEMSVSRIDTQQKSLRTECLHTACCIFIYCYAECRYAQYLGAIIALVLNFMLWKLMKMLLNEWVEKNKHTFWIPKIFSDFMIAVYTQVKFTAKFPETNIVMSYLDYLGWCA